LLFLKHGILCIGFNYSKEFMALLTKTINLFLFLALATILIISPLVTNSVFADKDDHKDNKPKTLESECVKKKGNDFDGLLCKAVLGLKQQTQKIGSFFDVFTERGYTPDSFFDIFADLITKSNNLQDQINAIKGQHCPTEQVMTGIDDAGKIICVPQLPPAHLTVSPSTHSFPMLFTGQSAQTTFTVKNTGLADSGNITVVLTGNNPNEFHIISNSCTTLAPLQSCTVDVAFSPTGTTGARAANIVVSANPGGSATASLTGMADVRPPAHLTVSPNTSSFPALSIGQSAQTTFIVGNTGEENSGDITVVITGNNQNEFHIISNSCTTLAPSELCTVDVVFSPTGTTGARAANIVVSANPGGSATASLTGIGN